MEQTDVLARKGYYDQMTNTFEDLHEKRDLVEREINELYEEREQIENRFKECAVEMDESDLRKQEAKTEKRATEKILRQLEAGGPGARAALRKLQLGKMRLEDRMASVREAFRASALSEAAPVIGQEVEAYDFEMPSSDGSESLLVRSYSQSSSTSSSAIVFFHGEGYAKGDVDTHDWLCRSLASLSGSHVVSIAYRLAPEVRFPVPLEDAYAGLCWVAEGGLGWTPSSVGVAGDCSGGGLAVACCLKARDEQGPNVAVQILFYPWLDVRPISESMLNCNEADAAHAALQEDLEFCSDIYAPPMTAAEAARAAEEDDDEEDPGVEVRDWMKDWRASPLLADSYDGMPRTFVAYALDDLCAPDSARYLERLRAENGAESVHPLALQGPLGHGFAKHGDRPQAYAAVAAAAAFASGHLGANR